MAICNHNQLSKVDEDVFICFSCGKHLKGRLREMTREEFDDWYKLGRVT